MHVYEKEQIQSKTGQVKMDLKTQRNTEMAPPVPPQLLLPCRFYPAKQSFSVSNTSFCIRILALCTLNPMVKQFWVQFGPTSFHEASATLLQTSLFKVFQTSSFLLSTFTYAAVNTEQ